MISIPDTAGTPANGATGRAQEARSRQHGWLLALERAWLASFNTHPAGTGAPPPVHTPAERRIEGGDEPVRSVAAAGIVAADASRVPVVTRGAGAERRHAVAAPAAQAADVVGREVPRADVGPGQVPGAPAGARLPDPARPAAGRDTASREPGQALPGHGTTSTGRPGVSTGVPVDMDRLAPAPQGGGSLAEPEPPGVVARPGLQVGRSAQPVAPVVPVRVEACEPAQPPLPPPVVEAGGQVAVREEDEGGVEPHAAARAAPEAAALPEPEHVHVYEDERGLQAWIRNATWTGEGIFAAAHTLRGEFARAHLVLAALTINGRRMETGQDHRDPADSPDGDVRRHDTAPANSSKTPRKGPHHGN